MRKFEILFYGALCLSSCACSAQQQTLPDAPEPVHANSRPARPGYTPPDQKERFRTYLHTTYGVMSILEAGIRGGIEQERNQPSGWPQGGQGYADRFGSSIGQIAVRGTTNYVLADLFREDTRFIPCRSSCTGSKFTAAFEDTFFARKGDDGHRAISVAKIASPWAGSAVTIETWYPAGEGRAEIVREAGLSYGFTLVRNLVRELAAH